MDRKNGLIEKVLKREWAMFASVQARHRAPCQEDPNGFRLMRGCQFKTWAEPTLESYLKDLTTAKKAGRNLMTEKYARMEGLIPPLNDNPLIDEIVAIELAWQTQMFERYPHLMAGARPLRVTQDGSWSTSFETYLRAEQETFSDATLAHRYRDVAVRRDEGGNMAEEVYKYLTGELGYGCVAEAEEAARKNRYGGGNPCLSGEPSMGGA